MTTSAASSAVWSSGTSSGNSMIVGVNCWRQRRTAAFSLIASPSKSVTSTSPNMLIWMTKKSSSSMVAMSSRTKTSSCILRQ